MAGMELQDLYMDMGEQAARTFTFCKSQLRDVQVWALRCW